MLLALEKAYSIAVKGVLYLATACIALSLVPALGTEWINIKAIAKKKERKHLRGRSRDIRK